MPSQFGGIPVDEPVAPQGGSRFGGIPVDQPDTSFISNYGQSFINAANEGRIGLEGLGQSVGRALYGANPQDASEQASRKAELDKIRSETAQSGVEPSGMAGTLGSIAGDIAGNPTSWTPLGEINGIGGLAKAGAKIGGLSGAIQNTDDNSIWNHLLNAGVGAAEGAAGSAALGKAGSAIAEIPGGIVNRIKGALADSAEDIATQSEKNWDEAHNFFKSSSTNGAVFNDISATNIFGQVKNAVGNLSSRHSDTAGVMSDFEKMLENGNVTPAQLHDIRQDLNDVISTNTKSKIDGGGVNADGQKALSAKNALDEALVSLSGKDLSSGSPQAINDLQNGINSTARAYRYDRIGNMLTDAGGDPNKIKSGAEKLLKSMKGLNEDEIDALQDMATRGTGQTIERALGTFGLDWGKTKNMALPVLAADAAKAGGAAMIPGGVPLVAAGTALRQTGKWAARGKGQNMLDAIMERDITPDTSPSVASQIFKLQQRVKGTAAREQGSASDYFNARAKGLSAFPSNAEAPSLLEKQTEVTPSGTVADYINPLAKEVSNNISNEKAPSLTGQTPKIIPKGNASDYYIPDKNAGKTSIGIPLAMSGAALAAQQALQKPATGSIGDQNMQQLQQIKQALPPESNAEPDVSKFAQAESSNNPNAKNPNSSASGLFQFTNRTWGDMVKRYGKQTGIDLKDKADPKAQAVMAQRYAQDNIASLQHTLGRMPTKGELYMAHVLGANGAAKLINADPAKEAIMLYPRQVFDANRDIFFAGKKPRTAGEVYQLLNSKVA